MIPQWTNDGRNVHSDSGAFLQMGPKWLWSALYSIKFLIQGCYSFIWDQISVMLNIGDLIILIWQYPSFRTEKSVTCVLLYYYICLNWHVLSKFSWGYILTINNEGRAATHQERVLTKSSLVNQWVYYDDLQEHEGPQQPYHKEIPSQPYTPCSLAAASLCSARAGRSHTQVRSPRLPTSSTREC